MRSKGFTLIELLAVIVILAIIALIAVPIILNMIGDSKEQANKRGKELYLEAVTQAIARKNLTEEFNPSTCKVKNDGNLTCDGKELTVEVNGTKPCAGTINFDNGSIVSKIILYCDEIPEPKSFEDDDWSTIVANVQAGNTDVYNLGDIKEVVLKAEGEDFDGKTFHLRISNKSTDECKSKEEGFSQTACGFVLEFVEAITTHVMNSSGESIGGWEYSEMRDYVNTTIYNALPDEIKDNIIDTYVVSGHESGKTSNYKTTDKLYLLSTKEVFGTALDNDTVDNETSQLDYYKSIGVTTSSYSGAIKKDQSGTSTYWWLRSADSNSISSFYNVDMFGYRGITNAITTFDVSLAFRL